MCFISNTNICLCLTGGEIRSKWNLLDNSDVLGATDSSSVRGISVFHDVKENCRFDDWKHIHCEKTSQMWLKSFDVRVRAFFKRIDIELNCKSVM